MLHGLHTPWPGQSWSESQLRPHCRTPAVALHCPAEQAVQGGQALPQAPQFRASSWRSVHIPPQEVRPGPHCEKQPPRYPFEGSWSQTCPVAQAFPQVPQLRGSVPVLVQAPDRQAKTPEVTVHRPPPQ